MFQPTWLHVGPLSEKPVSRQLLLDRVREGLEVDRQRRRADAERAEIGGRVARLTPRERQVMELVVSGNSNKVIAMDLGLCEKTVEVHRAHVMEKMKAQSLACARRSSRRACGNSFR